MPEAPLAACVPSTAPFPSPAGSALVDLIAWAEIALAAGADKPADSQAGETLRAARLDLLEALGRSGIPEGNPADNERLRTALRAFGEEGDLDPERVAVDLAETDELPGRARLGVCDHRSALVWHGLSLAQREAGYRVDAIRSLERSLLTDPSRLSPWLLLADLARELRNTTVLRAASRGASQLAPCDSRVSSLARAASPAGPELDEAEALLRDGNRTAALAMARAAVDKDPSSACAWTLTGQLTLRNPEGARAAAEAFRKALELQPNNAEVEVLLCDALCTLGDLEEAAGRLTRVLLAAPGHLNALLALARLRETQGDAAAAEKLLGQAVHQHPRAPAAARRLGDALKRRGALSEAQTWHWRSAGWTGPGPGDGRRRVLFLVQHVPMWLNMESVYAAFCADPAWEVTVVAMPHFHPYCLTDEERNAIFGYLQDEGVAYVRWDRFELKPGCADVMFVLTPWEVVRAPGWRTEELLRLGIRLAYIPYCYEAAHDDLDHASRFDEPLHQMAWAVFARSGIHKALFARYGTVGDAHVSVTGHPKADALRQLEAARDPELDAFVAGRKAVCWNPHFDVVDAGAGFGTGYSTFMRWGRFITEEFSRRPEMALIVRPHPLLFALLVRRGLWTQEEVDAFIARCASENIILDRRPSYLPAFAASDAMMSDISSFILEYPMTGKPLLYLRNPKCPYTEEGVAVGEVCEAAETEAGITAFLDGVAAGADPRWAERGAACETIIHHAPWGAGAAIKRVVDSRLKSEAGVIGPTLEAQAV
jgi:tetratricopeptide (TPR) repeat protein